MKHVAESWQTRRSVLQYLPKGCMKQKYIIVCIVLGVLCVSFPVAGQQQILSRTGPYFGIGIEQNGRAIPLENHEIVLQRAPFTLVLTFPGQEGVLVNASVTPETFEAAQSNKTFAEMKGFSDLGMAEEAFNPRALLMLSARAPHFWYYAHEGEHRFNDVVRRETAIICRRIVANVMYRDVSKQITSIRDIPEDSLYLVFMKTEWNHNYTQQFEKQRDYIKITFQ